MICYGLMSHTYVKKRERFYSKKQALKRTSIWTLSLPLTLYKLLLCCEANFGMDQTHTHTLTQQFQLPWFWIQRGVWKFKNGPQISLDILFLGFKIKIFSPPLNIPSLFWHEVLYVSLEILKSLIQHFLRIPKST